MEMEGEQEEMLTREEIRRIEEWKRRQQRDARWASQPSKAPLHSQESCLVS